MKTLTRLFKASITCTLLSWIVPAHAYLIYFGEDLKDDYTNNATRLASFPLATAAQSDFLAHLDTPVVENFEKFEDNDKGPLDLQFGGVTATLTGNGLIRTIPVGETNPENRYATSGTNYWSVVTSNTQNKGFEIEFSTTAAAFGFHGIDIGDAGGRLMLSLFNGDTPILPPFVIDHTLNRKANGAVFYYGLIAQNSAELFNRVSFSLTDVKPGDTTNDGFAFDDMTIALADQVHIPEPASGALMLIGLSGILWLRRKA